MEPSRCKSLLTDVPEMLQAAAAAGRVSEGAFCESAKHWSALNSKHKLTDHLVLCLANIQYLLHVCLPDGHRKVILHCLLEKLFCVPFACSTAC